MVGWLRDVSSARQINGHVYEIRITGYGPADVGPYSELIHHVESQYGTGSKIECHHIVEAEHLLIVPTKYNKFDAPAVAIRRDLHIIISTRFTSEHTTIGGRRGGIATVTKNDLLEIYEQIYTRDTRFKELFLIAKRVLG